MNEWVIEWTNKWTHDCISTLGCFSLHGEAQHRFLFGSLSGWWSSQSPFNAAYAISKEKTSGEWWSMYIIKLLSDTWPDLGHNNNQDYTKVTFLHVCFFPFKIILLGKGKILVKSLHCSKITHWDTLLTLSDWFTSTSSEMDTGKQRAWERLLELIVLIPNSWLW